MATRFYGVATAAAPVSPAFGGWTTTAVMARRSLDTGQNSTSETITVNLGGATGNNGGAFQLISPPLAAQTISGTFSGMMRSRELATSDNVDRRWRVLKVVSNDGLTVRGTLISLAVAAPITELGTSLAGYLLGNAVALTSVTCLDGDRIVIEIGVGESSTGTTPQADVVIGGLGTDLALADATATGTISWFEFSQNLTFQPTGSNVTLTPVAGSFSAVSVAPASGPTSVTLSPVTGTTSAPSLAASPGPTSVTLTPVVGSFSAPTVGLGSPSAVTLTPITGTFSAPVQIPQTRQPGLNISGGEFVGGAIPGVLDTDYHYDGATSLAYLFGRGYRKVRLPFLWERTDTTGQRTDLTNFVTRALTAGFGKVGVDMHNFGGRDGKKIGESGGPVTSDLTARWVTLSNLWKTEPRVEYDLMNEPANLPGVAGGFTANVTHYDFESTAQGWAGEAGVTVARTTTGPLNGTGSLRAQKTMGAGFDTIRFNDASGLADDISSFGDTLRVLVQIESGAPGTGWAGRIEVQNSSFAWIAASNVSLTPGTTTELSFTPTAGLLANCRAIGIQVEATGANAAVGVRIDIVRQGTVAGTRTPAQQWEDIAAATVAAIRGNGDPNRIKVEGYAFSAVQNWTTNHPAPFIPAQYRNIVYSGHYYLDGDHSGTYAKTFDQETSDAVAGGYASITARCLAEIAAFISWGSTNGVALEVGEIGWPDNDPRWNAVGAAVMDAFRTGGVPVYYWAVGEWWGTSYALSLYDWTGTTYTLSSQSTTVEAFLAPPIASTVTLTPAGGNLAATALSARGTVTLTPVTGSFAAVPISASGPPASNVTLTPIAGSFSVPALGLTLSPVLRTLTPITGTFSAPAVAPSSGSTSVTLSPVTGTFSAVSTTQTVGPTSVTLSPVVGSFSAPALGTGSTSQVTLTPVVGSFSARPLSLTPTVVLVPVAASFSAPVVGLTPVVPLSPVVGSFSAPSTVLTPRVILTPVTGSFSAQPVGLTTPAQVTLTPILGGFSGVPVSAAKLIVGAGRVRDTGARGRARPSAAASGVASHGPP